MLKPKKKICNECGREDYIFSKGRCKSCSQKSYKGLSSTTRINPITKKTQKKKREQSKERNEYFEYHLERCKESEETGNFIPSPNRSNICHLIDKGRHKSVQANLDNYLYLTFEEHTRFDELLFVHDFEQLEKEFKNSWPIACERYQKLLPLTLERTSFYTAIKKYINERYNNNIT